MLPSLIEGLLDPAAYPEVPEEITLSQTHLSYLIFTPSYVYKIKKPVNFGFVDFTTLEKRHHYCLREIELNRRLCPDIYLDVVEITRESGRFQIESKGHPTEYAVKMKKLPAERMLSELLRHDRATEEMICAIAKKIAAFHRTAKTSPEISRFGDISIIRQNTEENFNQIAPFGGRTIEQAQLDLLAEYSQNELREKSSMFINRAAHGHVRDCHGDIHAENICVGNDIYIYDCIEFNERFRFSDTIADIAFLIMDLEFRGFFHLAKVLTDIYRETSNDDDLDELLDFYKIYRAVVRGKVHSFKLDEEEIPDREKAGALHTAQNYFGLACRYAEGSRPLFFVVGGLTGTGKSTLARGISQRIGAMMISSDMVRKELVGIPPETRQREDYGKGIYNEEMTKKTYTEMFQRAEEAVSRGESVILDATFITDELREEAAAVGIRAGSEPVFIDCRCPEDVVMRRLRERYRKKKSVSDGRLDIYQRQKQRVSHLYPPGARVLAVDTSQPFPDALASIFERLWTSGLTVESLV